MSHLRPYSRWTWPLVGLLLSALFLLGEGGTNAQSDSVKLSGALQELLNQRRLGFEAAQSYARTQGVEIRKAESGDERLVVVVESVQNIGALLQAQAGILQAKYKDLWQVDLPLGSLRAVAAMTAVNFVRLPQVARLARPFPFSSDPSRERVPDEAFQTAGNSIISQGVALIGATALHDEGIRGQGVKVGILDLGFAGLQEAIEAGELPASVVAWDCLGSSLPRGTRPDCREVRPAALGAISLEPHGTAVAEIVHDVAPDAELHLFLVNTEVELGQAMLKALDQRIQIINHSVAWFNDGSFYDGHGAVARIVHDAWQNGILWVNAAGNFALHHYEMTFQDKNGDDLHDEPLRIDTRALLEGEEFLILFTWDDWPRSWEDFDLELMRGAKTERSSHTPQRGTEPAERLGFSIGSNLDQDIFQVNIKWAGDGPPPQDRRLELFILGPPRLSFTPSVQESSLPAPNNVRDNLVVGAVGVSRWEEGVPEAFSSQGPTNTGESKPDLVGPDCVRTFSLRSMPSKALCGEDGLFAGTSAAAPHVTGAAALLWSQDLNRTPEDIVQILKQRAQPVSLSPNKVGAGKVEVSGVRGADLVILGAERPTSSVLELGQQAQLIVRLKNVGEQETTPFWVAVWLKDEVLQPGLELSSKRVSPGLAIDEEIELTLHWTLTRDLDERIRGKQMDLIIIVDAFDDVQEKDENNNRFEFSIPLKRLQPARLAVEPTGFTFQAREGEGDPPPQQLTIRNVGERPLFWAVTGDVPWIQFAKRDGTLNGGEEVSFDVWVTIAQLGVGQHTGTITISAAEALNSPLRVPVQLEVQPQAAQLEVEPEQLTFSAREAGNNPGAQTLSLRNSGGQPLRWMAEVDVNWLSLSRTQGELQPGDIQSVLVSVQLGMMSAGTYHATITISSPQVSMAPIQIPVKLQLNPREAQLEVEPISLSFSAQEGGRNPRDQTLTIKNTGGQPLSWTASENVGWLSLSRTQGDLPPAAAQSISVSVNITGLSVGTRNATITIASPEAKNSPVQVSVTLQLESRPARLEVTPSSLSFSAQEGGRNPRDQTLTIKNTGGQPLSWTASENVGWLTLSRTQGSLPPGVSQTLTVSVNITGLAAGTRSATITVSSPEAQNSPVQVNVTLKLEIRPAQPEVTPSSLSFSAQEGGSNPSSKSLKIQNTGGKPLNWTASDNASWLSLSRTRGEVAPGASQSVTVSVNISGLTAGSRNATITLVFPDLANLRRTIPVKLTLHPRPAEPGGLLFVSSNGASFGGSTNGKITRIDLDTFLASFITFQQPVVTRLDRPEDGVCGPDGRVYFVDRDQGKVISFNQDGRNVTTIAEISRPEGITFDANGDLFVSADDGIYKIPRADPTNRPQRVIAYRFDRPGGIVFLSHGPYAGDLLAVDIGADVVWRFPRQSSSSFGEPIVFISSGLKTPTGIALNSRGEVFVANFEDRRILQFSASGVSQGVLGEKVNLRLFRPIHLEFDGADNLYIAEWGDFVGQGWVAMFNPSNNEFNFISSLVDAWGVALCRN